MKTLSDKPINLDPLQNSADTETVDFYSDVMRDLYRKIAELARREDNIVIVGEQGTGKHRTAKLIHSLSSFSDEPFANLFCNSLEETIREKRGELERMLENGTSQNSKDFGMDFFSGGTLFFNSFSELSQPNREILGHLLYNAQQMAIHIGERRNFRIIISVKKSAYTEFADHPFWNDLLDQLKPAIIRIPPLRERCEDIILLIDQFLIGYARKNSTPVHAISHRAAYKCISYYWPGNIRQLKNTIEHAATIVPPGSVITNSKLPFSIEWKSPGLHIKNNLEHNKSFLRAEKLLLKNLVAKSNLNEWN